MTDTRNTVLSYVYNSEDKCCCRVNAVIKGAPNKEAVEFLNCHCEKDFIPQQIGLPSGQYTRYKAWDEGPVMHVYEGACTEHIEPTVPGITIGELVEAWREAEKNWDDSYCKAEGYDPDGMRYIVKADTEEDGIVEYEYRSFYMPGTLENYYDAKSALEYEYGIRYKIMQIIRKEEKCEINND